MNEPARRRGRLYLITAPSGAGKTSLVKALVQSHPRLEFSISYTTRPKRPTETEGRDYHFVGVDEFRRMIEAGEFLEHAQVFDNYYGTARHTVESSLGAGRDVLLEIDWQGARQVREALPEAVSIFILPPSRAELERRLRNRGTDSDEVIARRLRDAVADMSHWSEFDYVVVNDNFALAQTALGDILAGKGEASRSARPALAPVVSALLA
ncbi:MAG TPA: guanylate kinase [Gammaproteobacteria bacterium]|nr:guanylate kinase [Gammaproteobacteria bacterium]